MVEEGDAYALIEGNHGPGPIAAIYAAEVAAAKAAKAGCAMVGVRNSDDLFIAGYYVELIARQGMVGFLFSDDVMCRIHPLGGTEQMIGTNPMAIAVPTAGEPFVLDFAPTAFLPTYVRYTRRYGRRLPEGVAQDVDGRPTTDPEAVSAAGIPNQAHLGAISPLGNKGYALLLAIDFLSGAFVGCDMGTDHATKPGAIKGHFFMAANPAMFGGADAFKRAVSGRIRQLRESRKAPDYDEIRIPGERSFAARARALRDGEVSIDQMCWEDTVKLAAELGVPVPE
jgi:LDH2 family malate/lactate/ureidoglycolate dehydrogenase